MTELKPCPFCGSYAIRIAKDKLPDGGYIYDARCTNCGCGSPFRCTEEEVVEAWNKRVPCDTCAMYYPDDGCMAGLTEGEVEK